MTEVIDCRVCKSNLGKKIKVKEIVQEANYISIISNDMIFNESQEIDIIIKNIKTRDEYTCSFMTENGQLKINLESVAPFFTDYEGGLYVTIKEEDKCYTYKPIYLNQETLYNNTDSELKWYIRTLENGELRFSSVTTKRK